MAAQQGPVVVTQEDARIGLQRNKSGDGGILRSRIPSGIINAMGAGDGDYFRHTLYKEGQILYVVTEVISAEEASPRDVIAERQAASKKSGKRATKKKSAGNGLDAAFGADEDEDEDDGSVVEVAPARRPRPAPVAVAPRRAAPAAVAPRRPSPAASSGGRRPRVVGAIAKPGRTRRARGRNRVGYSRE